MEIGSIDLNYKFIDELTPIADDEGNTGLYYTHNSQLYFLILSPNQEVTLSKTYHRPDATFLGTKITDRSFMFYFQNNLDKKELYVYALSKVDETSHVQNVLFTDSSQEEVISAITENKAFYIITAEKNTNFVHIYNFQDTESFKKITFVTDMPDLYKRLKKADFKHVRFDFNHTAYTGHFKEKVYLYDKCICFSIHRYDLGSSLEKTEILILDLETEKYQYHDVIHSREGFDRFSNSFLYKNYLFYTKSNHKALDISVYDIDTKYYVKNFSYGKDDEIDIISGNAVQEFENNSYGPDSKTLHTTKDILKELSKGSRSIAAEPSGDHILLTIGSYRVAGTGGGAPMMMPTPGGTISTPYGNVAAPTQWSTPVYYWHKGAGVSTYFRAKLTFPNLEKTKSGIIPDNVSRLEQYIKRQENRNVKISNKAIFKYGKSAQLIYLDKKENQLKIVGFGRQFKTNDKDNRF